MRNNIFGWLLLFFLEGTKNAFIKELRVDYVDENGNKSYYYREKHSHWVVAFLLFSLTCYLIVFVLRQRNIRFLYSYLYFNNFFIILQFLYQKMGILPT